MLTPTFILLQRGHLDIEEETLSSSAALNTDARQAIMRLPHLQIPDEKEGRFCVLSYEQVTILCNESL
jgi:hypothetical protein